MNRRLINLLLLRTAMCMTGFTPPPLAKIYFATVHELAQPPPTIYSNCSERLWLYARAILVALENYSGCPGELFWLARGVKSKQFRTCLTYASSFFPLCLVSKMRIQHCLCREVDEIWQYRTGGNLTIFDKDHDAAEEGQRRSLQLPCAAGGN